MTRVKRLIRSATFLTLWLGTSFFASYPAQARTTVLFNPPRGGAPQQTRGGASRGDLACTPDQATSELRLIALTPKSTYGLTLADHPSVFAYIPPTSAPAIFFNLKDEQGQVIYQTTLPLVSESASEGGVIRVDLPKSIPALELNKPYQWSMAVLCTGRLLPDSPFISSWVQRTESSPELTQQVTAAAPFDQATLYAANGIWYDTLTTLADLRQQHPDNADLTSTWATLLDSVELGTVSSAPFIEHP
jgi:hypothetical protein